MELVFSFLICLFVLSLSSHPVLSPTERCLTAGSLLVGALVCKNLKEQRKNQEEFLSHM